MLSLVVKFAQYVNLGYWFIQMSQQSTEVKNEDIINIQSPSCATLKNIQ